MTKKTEIGEKYIKAATDSIKSAGSLRALYRSIYGVDPTRQELQRFTNRLNPARSNPATSMLGVCIEHLPSLHEKTLKEFFGIQGEGYTAKQGAVMEQECDPSPDPNNSAGSHNKF
ncbi:TPA: hypothetical protein P2N04_004452 [Aeromonas salmonicida]|uniref:Uncharacterized protein n=2 Tax=Aeromonas salmonicida subsp. salmonicida TaxID=29491 RepID=A0A1Z3MNJ1_AERSS|nr:hypothetical protein [Aeromonas salmonicida]ASD49366.1 hypothetical protein [Aeromonas salmonicida subsp. salmonicida]QEO86294.1 hypothetical protein E3D14_23545 [Aeromonas salmonicida subsp. salmonicida]UDQ60617.1 hypothetical protein LJF99_23715 [Aeromonas salmonicida subsp. salmonicida]HDN9770497.1 hypothetical protein [Aeromonas salmonicida]HDN9793063.1 hypothetical protein [Aeromonas salmonicida]